jgi:UDP-N-acetylglucosamine--N-acetylmuramyl-(pentapeptide) pyrophosphoryl-undecaprenol N-acetylglucosamine transferase
VTIGLAIARAYEERHPSVAVLFLGTGSPLETKLVDADHYEHRRLPAFPIAGEVVPEKLRALWRLRVSVREARALLESHRTELVIGVGGYASAGALLAARSLGLPSAIHEANAVPGLANRFLSRLVDRVYLGFSTVNGNAARGRYTGVPVRPEFEREASSSAPDDGRPSRILVVGGSQGSRFLNAEAPGLLRALRERGVSVEVEHQTGDHDPEPVRAAYHSAGVEAQVEPFLFDMPAAYARARFVIACPGAATLAELSACGVPSLLVPRADVAADHQTANAIAYCEQTNASWSTEAAWDAEALADSVAALLRDPAALSAAARAARGFGTRGAAFALVDDCEQMLAEAA